MRFTLFLILGIGAAITPLPTAHAAETPAFAWKDGDRVVLIGDTFVEREQSFGYLETLITAQNPEKTIIFRNLGWSGDTVGGLSRARFGSQAEGFSHLKEHVTALRPSVLIVGYGMAESFAGEAGLSAFVAGYEAMLDAVAPPNCRLVLLSPIAHEDLGRPLPDPAKHNADLARYRDAIKTVAGERKAWFVDLYETTLSARDYGIGHLTDNGIHPTAYGYWSFAHAIDSSLRNARKEPAWSVRIDRAAKSMQASRMLALPLETTAKGVRFVATSATLPFPPRPPGAPEVIGYGVDRLLRVAGLGEGMYALTVDGKTVASGDAGTWTKPVRFEGGPDFEHVERLRAAIVEKNQLYFHRWRPQNETYLFGFRKHEQGNNAREIPRFDPLVEAKEKEIAGLKKPVSHVYELTLESEVAK